MIFRRRQRDLVAVALVISLALLLPVPVWGQETAAREYLEAAKAAAFQVPDPAEQSAAFSGIALLLANRDPAAALDLAARTRVPSAAARTLGAAALALSSTDPTSANQDVVTAGRLLLRISNPDQRAMEQRLLLREVALLGDAALSAAPELTPGEAQLEVVLARAETDPRAALALLRKWEFRGIAYDQVAAAVSCRLAATDPDEALNLASSILSTRARDRALWRIAEQRPAEEAESIAVRITDPVAQSAVLRSAALRTAPQDSEVALRLASGIVIAPNSAQAEIAAALALRNQARAIEMAREMPPLARRWTLSRLVVGLARSHPDVAANLLSAGQAYPEAARLAAAAMATAHPQEGVSLARSLPSGEERDAALAFVARALAQTDPTRAKELLWEIATSRWRTAAASAVATALALVNLDEATGVLGLVTEPADMARIRASIGARVAGRDAASAERLISSLPTSQAKAEAGLEAAANLLAARGPLDIAIGLASAGIPRDPAIRWLVPSLAYAQTRSPLALAEKISSPYLRALALVDLARTSVKALPRPRPAPDRAAQIRPIVEWEAMGPGRATRAEGAATAPRSGCELRIASPSSLTVRIQNADPRELYRITYDDGGQRFVWENLTPNASGDVVLTDDRHLRPEYRLGCESRTGSGDPVVFDDLLKGAVVGQKRLPFGVPVSTFGGAGYLVPGVSDLRKDDFGNFWLYLAHEPEAILKYGPDFHYQFALLLPDAPLAHDTDSDGNLYVLHPGNWVSKHSPLGETIEAWELPVGRSPGEVISASGLVIDRAAGAIYLADEALGRVQRFDLDLRLRPLPFTPWGWIGRGELTYSKPGEYDRDHMLYQLDRPRQLILDGRGSLLVSSEHYISKFDLATGRQTPFGRSPVLGWGVTFTDSAFSQSAGLDGHWQRQWLAGVDAAGNIYVADRENEFVADQRLQVFGPDGVFVRAINVETDLRDALGRPVHIGPVKGIACTADAIYLVDAAGRIYQSPSPSGIVSGGALHLGPGAAGRQFDLSQVDARHLSVEVQDERVKHRFQGRLLAYGGARPSTGNCEREGTTSLADGERSMWTPARIGEPFTVTLLDASGNVIPSSDYLVEYEDKPGLFGSHFDFFRVTNRSGRTWEGVTFIAEAAG